MTKDELMRMRELAEALRYGFAGVDVERFRLLGERVRAAGIDVGKAAQRELERIGLRRTR